MIVLDNLEKVYELRAGKSWVLRRSSLEIRAGELVTVMGPSGAGKSTLLAAIAAVATVVPARRAATVDPMQALRYE